MKNIQVRFREVNSPSVIIEDGVKRIGNPFGDTVTCVLRINYGAEYKDFMQEFCIHDKKDECMAIALVLKDASDFMKQLNFTNQTTC